MNSDTKIISIIGAVTVLVIIAGVFLAGNSAKRALPEIRVQDELLVRDTSLRIKGSNPKVQLVEFADFQCPACAMFHPTLKRIKNEYKDSIDFVFRVLPIHQYSVVVASAVFAAREQGKMIEMHDIVFEKQDEWAAYGTSEKEVRAFLESYAQTIGLNIDAFKKDMQEKANSYKTIVDQDATDAATMGIQSTPTLLINGKPLVRGVVSYDQLRGILERELNPQTTASTTEQKLPTDTSNKTLPAPLTGSVVNGTSSR